MSKFENMKSNLRMGMGLLFCHNETRKHRGRDI